MTGRLLSDAELAAIAARARASAGNQLEGRALNPPGADAGGES